MPQGSSLCVRSLRAKDPHFRFGLELGSVRRLAHHSRMAEAELKATVDKIMDIGRVLNHASPDDKAEIFRQLGLKLTTTQADGSSKPRSNP
jgi:hypothetical protein